MTIREAIRRLQASLGRELNPHYAKGAAEGLGIVLVPVGSALTMTEQEYLRLEEHLRSIDGAAPDRRQLARTQ